MNLTDQKANLAKELYAGFGDGTEVFAAYCCGRVSLSRRQQTRCTTCTKIPQPAILRSTDDAIRWGEQIPWTPPEPAAQS